MQSTELSSPRADAAGLLDGGGRWRREFQKGSSMALKDRVTAAMIRLDIGKREKPPSSCSAADGTINRMGTGEEGSVE
ncbi:MAG: hypothetical protein IPF66_25245 [Holophagales bacterium]|nr:hypothetical protein [Holophagales bacterium]